jgi:hypothetical protein
VCYFHLLLCQKLGRLVNRPFVDYKDALEIFKAHEAMEYHKRSVLKAQHFMEVMKGEREDVRNALSNERQKQVAVNRQRLEHIIKVIEFCARQELPFRGHRDHGEFSLKPPVVNDGTFRSALRLRLNAADEETKSQFESGSRNATYLSWKVQNEVIEALGQQIQQQIVNEVKKANFYAVLVDETTDISRAEQLTISVRYVHEDKVKEDFIAFLNVEDCTGSSLASTILQELERLGLDLNLLRGQGYDGGSNMKGKYRGVQAVIRERFPLALYTHCNNHILNLAINHASSTPAIRNAIDTLKEVCSFFNGSAKRVIYLNTSIENQCPNTSHSRLKTLCETRWVERHDGILVFVELLPAIFDALEILEDSKDVCAAVAGRLLNSISTSKFIIAILVLESVSALLLPLSKCQYSTFNTIVA